MKLIRFGAVGAEKPGIQDEAGNRYDASAHFDDWNRAFFNDGGMAKAADIDLSSLPRVPEDERWASCIARPGKVLCVGLNYSDHAEESGMPIPEEPILFMKGSNTVVGPYDNVIIPRNSEKCDWEVELGIVIGKDARYLNSVEEAREYIAGYCISHDVSERAFQLERGGQWCKGKSADNFNPVGPFLLSADACADVNNLDMTLHVNGEQKQNGNTKTMIFDPFFIVHYCSQFMCLEAGDLISTGTPPGVGFGMNPPQYLQAGDEVELSIVGLGSQKQTCVNA